ncbi:MAG: glycosyltransferase family 39 protein [Chloroflexi bacterium]|nr:glycosyltransferase family 39 protein [Chloroflexota bacterium]
MDLISQTREKIARARRAAEPFPWELILCAAGIALRWAGLSGGSLWYDEAYSVVMARFDLLEMIGALRTNISPPGWEIVIWVMTRAFGENDFAFRLAPFIVSVLTLVVFWKLTQEFHFTRAQAIFGLALLALSPYQLWLAQEARMYAVMSLLYLLGILWARQGKYLGLAAVMGLLLWLHNTAIFYLLSLGLFALIVHPRDWRAIVVAGAVALLAWLPWAPILLTQSGQAIPWIEPLTWQALTFNFVFDLFASTASRLGGSVVPILLFFVTIVTALILQTVALVKKDATRVMESLWMPAYIFWMPFVLFLASNFLFRNALHYRSTSVLLPPLMLWLAAALIPHRPKLYHAILPVLWIGAFVAGLALWSPKDRGGNLAQVVQVIEEGWQSGDVIYHANEMTAVLFSYYLPDKPHYVIDEQELAGGRGMIDQAKLAIPRAALEKISHRRAWLVSPYYDYASPPDERAADRRMRVYARDCMVAGIIPYWHHAWVGVYLCGDPAREPK